VTDRYTLFDCPADSQLYYLLVLLLFFRSLSFSVFRVSALGIKVDIVCRSLCMFSDRGRYFFESWWFEKCLNIWFEWGYIFNRDGWAVWLHWAWCTLWNEL